MKRTVACLLVLLLLPLAASLPAAKSEEKKAAQAAEKRSNIDRMVKETLAVLFEKAPPSRQIFDKAYGYAVFDNLKLAFGLTGGGGVGRATNRKTGAHTYMKMGTAGIGLGLGGQKYQVVFFFETKEVFDQFVDKGWQADAAANAAAGKAGANAEATFTNGMAFYILTQAGLMLQADIAGTKYWKSDKLNM